MRETKSKHSKFGSCFLFLLKAFIFFTLLYQGPNGELGFQFSVAFYQKRRNCKNTLVFVFYLFGGSMNVVFLIYAFILFCQQRYSNVLNYNVIYNNI